MCPLSYTHPRNQQGKKEEAPAPADAFDATEKAVLEAVSAWTKGTFTVSRVVYGENEALCVAIENAIWHEAERLKLSLETVKSSVAEQVKWLSSQESDMKNIVTMVIQKRFARELACANRLVEMIGEVVEQALPIKEHWLVAPDAISVHPATLSYPPDADPIVPKIKAFYADHLNEEQTRILEENVEDIRTGGVALEEDVIALLHRALSTVGPYGSVALSPTSSFSHVMLPVSMRNDRERLQNLLAPNDKIPGTAEHFGVVSAASIVKNL